MHDGKTKRPAEREGAKVGNKFDKLLRETNGESAAKRIVKNKSAGKAQQVSVSLASMNHV